MSPRSPSTLAAAALLATAAAAPAGPLPGERYALLVGVRSYSEARELRALAYTERDVTELAEVLRAGGYRPESVYCNGEYPGGGDGAAHFH